MKRWLPLGALLCFSICAAAAPDDAIAPEIDYMAQLMWEAEQARGIYPDIARVNPALTEDALYAVQQRYVALTLKNGKTIGGYKGGLIPVAPIGGVLYREGFVDAPARVDARKFARLIIEAEIAFEFCASVTAPLVDIAALKRTVCKLHPAIELPDAAIHDLATIRTEPRKLARALIPNDLATRMVMLGSASAADAVNVDAVTVVVRRGDEILGERNLKAPSDLWHNVFWIVNEFVIKRGYALAPGQIIIAGNLTGLHPGLPGKYQVDYGELGRVEFEVTP